MSQNNDEAVQASPSETREDTSSLVSSGHSGNRPEETSNQLVRGEMASQPAEPFNMSSSSSMPSIVTTSSSESGRGIPAFGSSLGIQNLDQSLTSLMPENQFIVHSNPSVRTSAQTNQFLISRARSALADSSLSLVASRAIGNHSVSEIRNIKQFNATANPSAIPATNINQEDIFSDQLTVVSSESGSALSYNQLNTFTNLSSNVDASGNLLRALVNQTLTQVVNSNINQISSSANLSSTPSLNFNHMSPHAHRANQPPTSDIHHLSMPRRLANQVPTSSWAHQSLTQFGQPNRPSVPNVQSNFLFTGTSEPVTSSTPVISSSRRLQTSTVFTNSILAVPVASTYPSWSSISHTLFTGTNSQLTTSTPSTSNINTSQPPAASQNLARNSRTPSTSVINTSQPSVAIQNISGNSRTPSTSVINTSQPSVAIQNISGNSTFGVTHAPSPAFHTMRSQTGNSTLNAPSKGEHRPSYEELAVIAGRAKRPEMALVRKRMESFADWPENRNPTKEDLVDAGFYATGRVDATRCFWCAGGLKNWDPQDSAYVEHARVFPRCPYIRHKVGEEFINVVSLLAKRYKTISFEMVLANMTGDTSRFSIDKEKRLLLDDPAVVTLCHAGYGEENVLEVASLLKQDGQTLSSDTLFTMLEEKGATREPQKKEVKITGPKETVPQNLQDEEGKLRNLKTKTEEMRAQVTCKVCLERSVGFVFLPCGHMVCCEDCAWVMRECPVCRKDIKGMIKSSFGD